MKKNLAEKHSFTKEAIFQTKSTLLIIRRFIENIFSSLSHFKKEEELISKPIISHSESDLWNPFDNQDNWILTAGKIENLRIAVKNLNGLEIKANETFSFWKHIGNPNFGKGYVVGREIREGCIVPTIAGGLCQLSNALYDAALKANFEIVERHKHSKVVKGSLAEQDRDATVKWNYVDLRFKSKFDVRIEIELSSDNLLVVFKSEQKNISDINTLNINLLQSSKLNDCYSCGNLACFKHSNKTTVKQKEAKTTFILDEFWAEHNEYIQSIATENDFFILPLQNNHFLFKTNRYNWTIKNPKNLKFTSKQGIWRALRLRIAAKTKENVFNLSLNLDKRIAQNAAKHIPLETTHLVISQNLLPFLFETGALGGRTYDVLMTRLPIEKLHENLDFAHKIYPESTTLNDFRAPQSLIELENKALTKAQKVITPHEEIADIFRNKAIKLAWHLPKVEIKAKNGIKILFPASAFGRKGAYEVRKLAKELNLNLFILGNASEKNDFWKGISIQKFTGDYSEIGLIIYPTYVENQPRQVLKAISMGVPIVTTATCGLPPMENVTICKTGDYDSLKLAVLRALK